MPLILPELRQQLDALDIAVTANLQAIGDELAQKNLPAVIQQRHQDMVATLQTDITTLRANLDSIQTTTDWPLKLQDHRINRVRINRVRLD